MRTCTKCNLEKDDDCFAWKIKAKRIKSTFCRECRNLYTKSHYEKNKSQYLKRIGKSNKIRKQEIFEKFLSYISDKFCKICGENDIRVLEFDHRVSDEKRDSVYTLVSKGCSWKTIMKEIDKCDILCANCHRKKTNIQFNTYRQKFIDSKELQGVRRGISGGS